MPENLKQNEGIESERDAGELETKQRDRIRARCRRTRNKTKGSNMGAMPESPKQNEGIESRRDAREPETKRTDRIWARCRRTRNKMKGSNVSKGAKKGLCPSIRHQYHVRNSPLHIKSKSQSLKYYEHSFLRKSPPH